LRRRYEHLISGICDAENPYAVRLSAFQPGATATWPREAADTLVLPLRPGSAAWKVAVILHQLAVPVLRRVIEAILVQDHGLRVEAVTEALATVVNRGIAFRTEVRFMPKQRAPDHVYSIAEVAPLFIDALRPFYRRREEVLSAGALGDAGESYVRGALLHTGRYRLVTQPRRLGGATRNLDVEATHEATGSVYGISVKNESEYLTGRSKHFKDLLNKVHGSNLRPMLIVTNATSRARKMAQHLGVRLVTIGAQVVPGTYNGTRMATIVAALRPVLGPEPILYLPQRAGRAHYPVALIHQLSELA
jgi:hypothetical protein